MRTIVIILLFASSVWAVPRVVIELLPGKTNDTISVRIKFYEQPNVSAISLSLRFDQPALQYCGYTAVNNKIADALINNVGNEVLIGWDGIPGVSLSNESIITLKFKYSGVNTVIAFDTAFCEIADDHSIPIVTKFERLILPYMQTCGTLPTPAGYDLGQSYPNPCNPSARFRFTVPEKCWIEIKLYSILGCYISNIFQGDVVAGEHEVLMDLTKYNLSTGVYFYQLTGNNVVVQRKMNFLK